MKIAEEKIKGPKEKYVVVKVKELYTDRTVEIGVPKRCEDLTFLYIESGSMSHPVVEGGLVSALLPPHTFYLFAKCQDEVYRPIYHVSNTHDEVVAYGERHKLVKTEVVVREGFCLAPAVWRGPSITAPTGAKLVLYEPKGDHCPVCGKKFARPCTGGAKRCLNPKCEKVAANPDDHYHW